MPHAMTRFPQMRRRMLASAIIVPCLLYAAFLLFARGSWGWGACAIVIGLVIALIFPSGIPTRGDSDHEEETMSASIAGWGRCLATTGLWFWLIRQPELGSLLDRVWKDRALWDRWLIVPCG